MDASSKVLIGLAAATGLGTVLWYLVQRVLMKLDSNTQAVNGCAQQEDLDHLEEIVANLKVDVEKNRADTAQAISNRARQEDFELLKQHMSDFEIDCAKNFITQPALMQVMTSLDRTIQQLTQAITHNSQESREGLAGLNKRIDDLMHRGQ